MRFFGYFCLFFFNAFFFIISLMVIDKCGIITITHTELGVMHDTIIGFFGAAIVFFASLLGTYLGFKMWPKEQPQE